MLYWIFIFNDWNQYKKVIDMNENIYKVIFIDSNNKVGENIFKELTVCSFWNLLKTMERQGTKVIDVVKEVPNTYNIVFNNSSDSNDLCFKESFDYCMAWIRNNRTNFDIYESL